MINMCETVKTNYENGQKETEEKEEEEEDMVNNGKDGSTFNSTTTNYQKHQPFNSTISSSSSSFDLARYGPSPKDIQNRCGRHIELGVLMR